jgi:hypothetical protein
MMGTIGKDTNRNRAHCELHYDALPGSLRIDVPRILALRTFGACVLCRNSFHSSLTWLFVFARLLRGIR